MTREVFEAFDGQQEIFGYSQAVRVDDTIYVAGTVGIGENMHIPATMADQMELAYRNIDDTLAHFGASMSDVVEQRIYVTDMAEAADALDVRKVPFNGASPPASTMVEVSQLFFPELKCEIAVTARLRS